MKRQQNTIRHKLSAGKRLSVRGGFTLLEMMVAIGLVLLIMAMFAEIFDVVAGTMSSQKGIAKNDQKARTLTIIMKEDLEHRTFRRVFPFYPGQKTVAGAHGPHYIPQDRRGYFAISENDPDDPTDDVLAFTAQFDVPVSGKATMLGDLLIDDGNGNWILDDQTVNQPEFDDGFPPLTFANGAPQLDQNNNQITNRVGVSRTVEIVYFLRHGNLYRRVMLVREPYDDPLEEGDQPGALPGDYDFDSQRRDFWRDFDYSAYRDYTAIIGVTPGPKFHGSDSMNNDSEIPGTVRVDGNGDGLDTADVLVPPSLGIPFLRFGHSPKLGYGIPREFVGLNNGAPFIGRFTTQETAHSTFSYPGRDADPHDPQNIFFLNDSGLVDQFGNEIYRRGVDILMTNVHEFDIKVWDDYTEDFNRNRQLDNIPGLVEDRNNNNLIDEVHRFVDLGYGQLNLETPDANYTPNPVGYYHRDNVLNLDYSSKNPPRFRYDTWHPYEDNSGSNFGPPPFRPLHPFNGNDRVPGTFQDDDRDATLDNPSERGWLGSDDEVPLKAIQITVRFFDVESDQMRQLTLIHTLTD